MAQLTGPKEKSKKGETAEEKTVKRKGRVVAKNEGEKKSIKIASQRRKEVWVRYASGRVPRGFEKSKGGVAFNDTSVR